MFEFDKNKSDANKLKHGIDFDEAQSLWNGASIILKSKYPGEERWLLLAYHNSSLWAAIFTKRNEKIRIISVRKARDNEKKYFKSQNI